MASSSDIERLYQEGVAAIRAGDKATGRDKLLRVVELNEMHEQAWLWLSAAVDTREDRIVALENVLTINPDNEPARRGLEKLGAPIPDPKPLPPSPAAPPSFPLAEERPPRPPASVTPSVPSAAPASPSSLTPPPRPSTQVDQPGPSASGSGPPSRLGSGSLLAAVESHEHQPLQPGSPFRSSRKADDEDAWRSELEVPTLETVPEALVASSSRDAWEKALERQEKALSAKEQLQAMEAPSEKRTLLDLLDAWAAALVFRVQGTYEQQVQSGNVGHTLVSLAFAGLLSGVAALLMLLLVFTPMGGVEGLPVMAEVPANPAAIQEISRVFNMLGIGLAAVVFLVTIIGQLINGSFVHLGARILGGEGEWFQTLSGLSLATVAGQIVYLVPTVLLIAATFLGMSFATISSVINLASFVLGLYQAALNIVAVKTAHNFSGWRAFFAMMIGGLILGFGACCLGFGLVSLLGAGAGAMAPQ